MIIEKITLLGHKDHGKSTLIGNMLILTGRVNPAKLKEAERLSKSLGKPFEPGFILDSFDEERRGGLTIDTTRTEKIPYNDLAFEFIDVPGHEELIKNMISGASYADIALLIVSAKPDEGIRDQTKRHLFIARMLGINRLIVAVNKMDTIGYSEPKFREIKKELGEFIERIGFPKSNIYFVPISAYNKDNLVERSKKTPWYKERPLLDLLYQTAKREDVKPGKELRVILQGFVSPDSPFIAGKVVSGSVRLNDEVTILPSGSRSKVSGIIVKNKSVKGAKSGASVAIKLKERPSSEVRGSVMAGPSNLPHVGNSLRAIVFLTDRIDGKPRINFNGVDIWSKGLKVIRTIDTSTGYDKGSKPKRLDAIEAEVMLNGKITSESFSKTHELGRFVLYSDGKFAGIATVV